MKQNPSKLKFKKNHKIKYSNLFLNEQKVFFPLYGNFALKALESGKLTFKQIEACRKSIRRDVKKLGNVYIRAFTYFSITKKAVGIRMGKGKGNHFL
jgi:large subunit ribosomal protein L16